MKLATARYYNPNVPTCGLLPVGFTNGYPRFLKYKLAANLRQLAPDPSTIKMTDQHAFDALYRERLDRLGLEHITELLAATAGRGGLTVDDPKGDTVGLVLCCYERLDEPGAWCHRSVRPVVV